MSSASAARRTRRTRPDTFVRNAASSRSERRNRRSHPAGSHRGAGLGHRRADAVDFTEKDWDEVMDVNLKTVFFFAQAAARQFIKQKTGGKIVNIASSRVWEGGKWRLHYSASKGAVLVFTRALAREIGSDNICVNSISPGFTLSETPVPSSTNQHMASRAESDKCFDRDQVPDDLVGALMFLLSDASNYITGQCINVDGGRSMH